MRKIIEAGVAIGVSAAAGAALMYLMDPKAGEVRRRRLTEVASSALDSASQGLTSAAGTASESAYSAGSRAQELAKSFLQRATEAGQNLTTRARENIPIEALQPQPNHSTAKAVAGMGGAGALLLGAGAMYFLDPQKGEVRRAQIMDQAKHLRDEVGGMARRVGRYVSQSCSMASCGTSASENDDAMNTGLPVYETHRYEAPPVDQAISTNPQ